MYMAIPILPLPLPPLTKADLMDDSLPFAVDPVLLQLQVDTLNVLEARVDINTFPPEYQKIMMDYYRFSATKNTTGIEKLAPRTRDTMELL